MPMFVYMPDDNYIGWKTGLKRFFYENNELNTQVI